MLNASWVSILICFGLGFLVLCANAVNMFNVVGVLLVCFGIANVGVKIFSKEGRRNETRN